MRLPRPRHYRLRLRRRWSHWVDDVVAPPRMDFDLEVRWRVSPHRDRWCKWLRFQERLRFQQRIAIRGLRMQVIKTPRMNKLRLILQRWEGEVEVFLLRKEGRLTSFDFLESLLTKNILMTHFFPLGRWICFRFRFIPFGSWILGLDLYLVWFYSVCELDLFWV